MWLVHGISVIVTELVNDLLDPVMFSSYGSVAYDFLESIVVVMSRFSIYISIYLTSRQAHTLEHLVFAYRIACRSTGAERTGPF